MRKIMAIVTALVLSIQSGYVFASTTPDTDKIHWQDYAPGIFDQAKSTHHPVILLGKSTSCHYCEQIELNTFSNPAIIKLINTSYTPVVMDIDKNRDIFLQYKILKLPTTLIFDMNGKVVKVATGYIKSDRMIQILNHYANK